MNVWKNRSILPCVVGFPAEPWMYPMPCVSQKFVNLFWPSLLQYYVSWSERICFGVLPFEEIASIAVDQENVKLLMMLLGIDYYAAMVIANEIGDVTHFPDAKNLVSWTGLAPSLRQSGSRIKHGRITKQGSRTLRGSSPKRHTTRAGTMNAYEAYSNVSPADAERTRRPSQSPARCSSSHIIC